MGPWKKIDPELLEASTLLLLFIPPDRYAFSTGKDLLSNIASMPGVSHYCIVNQAPLFEGLAEAVENGPHTKLQAHGPQMPENGV